MVQTYGSPITTMMSVLFVPSFDLPLHLARLTPNLAQLRLEPLGSLA